MQEEKREIEAEKWDVKVENTPWSEQNITADAQFVMPVNRQDITGGWTNTEGESKRFDAKELHINVSQPGYSASAVITAFGVGALAGVTLLAILWTHLPGG